MTTVHDQLNDLRASFADCRLIAFVDLEAELVLSCSAALKPRQEELDALAAAAKAILLPEPAAMVDGSDFAATDEAILLSSEQSAVYLRAQDQEAEALVCICEPAQDLIVFRESARTALDAIMAAN